MEDKYCYYCMSHRAKNGRCPVCGNTATCDVPDYYLHPGTVLKERFLIGKALGQGGFGITYIGRDLTLNMKVAVKEYYPSGIATRNNKDSNSVTITSGERERIEKDMRKFLTEARNLARFYQNPNVVSVIDYFQENGTAYIVMEYLEGITLRSYLEKKGRISPEIFAEMIDPVLQDLHEIHKQGLIHRDISPDNIMMLKDGRLKLLDFGAARDVGDGKSTLTVVLKRGYAPIEQYSAKGKQGPWTDVYAVCATIYKCITGNTPTESTQRVLEDNLKKPSELGISIPHEYEQALMQGLAVKSTDRIQSVDVLRKAICHKTDGSSGGTIEIIDGSSPEYKPPEESNGKTTTMGGGGSKPEGVRPQKKNSEGQSGRNSKTKQFVLIAVCIMAVLIGCLAFAFGGGTDSSPTRGEFSSGTITSTYGGYNDSSEEDYAQAESLLSKGYKAGAAIAFGKIADYKDAREKSFKMWDEVADRGVVSAGTYHTVGLKEDGTVVATGRSGYGQCDVSSWEDIVAVSAGGLHTIGLKADGTVVATGNNDYGQCNVSGWTDIVAVSAGFSHTVALKFDGTVVAVGSNYFGECDVSNWTDIIAVSAGNETTVGLKSDGTVVAIGMNLSGECNVFDWTDIISISAGTSNTVALKTDGTIVAIDFFADAVRNASDIIAVSAGDVYMMALKSDGTVVSGLYTPDWTDIAAISGGDFHAVGLKADGTAVAIGDNDYGQCDVSGWADLKVPSLLPKIKLLSEATTSTSGAYANSLEEDYATAETLLTKGNITGAAIAFGKIADYKDARERSFELWSGIANRSSISAGERHTVGLKTDGTVIAVGYNDDDRCKVSTWNDIVAVSVGNLHTVGLTENGAVVAVGNNDVRQCEVYSWNDIVAISTGYSNTVGLKIDGTVVAAGFNDTYSGEMSGWTDIVDISVGFDHAVGLKSDGAVLAVGSSYYGECDVSDWTDIVGVSAGVSHTVGLKADGTVVATGYNSAGQCDVSDWTDIVAVSAGDFYTVGLKSNGTVVVAGYDYNISDWKNIVAVSAGMNHIVGLKSDSTVVAVGINMDGQCDVSDWTNIKLPEL